MKNYQINKNLSIILLLGALFTGNFLVTLSLYCHNNSEKCNVENLL